MLKTKENRKHQRSKPVTINIRSQNKYCKLNLRIQFSYAFNGSHLFFIISASWEVDGAKKPK